MFCPNCGFIIESPENKFCSNCGYQISISDGKQENFLTARTVIGDETDLSSKDDDIEKNHQISKPFKELGSLSKRSLIFSLISIILYFIAHLIGLNSITKNISCFNCASYLNRLFIALILIIFILIGGITSGIISSVTFKKARLFEPENWIQSISNIIAIFALILSSLFLTFIIIFFSSLFL